MFDISASLCWRGFMAREYNLRLPGSLAQPRIIQQISKAADELNGLARGILADGKVNTQEAAFFRDWVRSQSPALQWPFPALVARIDRIYADGVATEEECSELTELLKALLGGMPEEAPAYVAVTTDRATRLPLCDPAPEPLEFISRTFCITGKFAFGSRTRVCEAIESRGGALHDRVVGDTDYVLVGSFTSRGWKHGSYGNKIATAMDLRDRFQRTHIIGEEHWIKFL